MSGFPAVATSTVVALATGGATYAALKVTNTSLDDPMMVAAAATVVGAAAGAVGHANAFGTRPGFLRQAWHAGRITSWEGKSLVPTAGIGEARLGVKASGYAEHHGSMANQLARGEYSRDGIARYATARGTISRAEGKENAHSLFHGQMYDLTTNTPAPAWRQGDKLADVLTHFDGMIDKIKNETLPKALSRKAGEPTPPRQLSTEIETTGYGSGYKQGKSQGANVEDWVGNQLHPDWLRGHVDALEYITEQIRPIVKAAVKNQTPHEQAVSTIVPGAAMAASVGGAMALS